jgi:hypothetical protein
MLYCLYGHINTVDIGVSAEIGGTDIMDIEDIEFTKALKIRILYCIYGQDTTIHIGVSTDCIVFTAKILRFILKFQRKLECIDTVDIDNIDVQ